MSGQYSTPTAPPASQSPFPRRFRWPEPAESVLDVSITLYGEGEPALAGEKASEDCLVPPVGFEPTLGRF